MYIYNKDKNYLALIHNHHIIDYDSHQDLNFNTRLQFIAENLWRNKGYFLIENEEISLVLPVEKESQQNINTSVHNHVESTHNSFSEQLKHQQNKQMIREMFDSLFPKKENNKNSFLSKIKKMIGL